MRQPSAISVIGVAAACLGLPVAGALVAGRSLGPQLRFPPPLEIPQDYSRFSWLAAGLVLGAGALIGASWLAGRRPAARARAKPGAVPSPDPAGRGPSTFKQRRFPRWGWAAIVWTLAWWWLAWTRQSWFAWGQRYTFTPLWLGFIVCAQALTTWGGGAGPRPPADWLRLFAASAAFWWVFEWLNRFVRNWHYLGVTDAGRWEYAIHSTVCFSTVLPAVVAVRAWLGTLSRLQVQLGAGARWRWLDHPGTGSTMIAIGVAGLGFTGAQPLYFYPALWAAPLLIGVGWLILGRADGWWRQIAAGDWREAGSWALAALVCGLFWELWNLHSAAKWVYTVPFVQRWRVFEMPLLGYAGYLTFGLECAWATRWVWGGRTNRGPSVQAGESRR
ncbi:MAG TPA: hypothetical protein VLT83_15700 [Opitutaceae bacterium]|nr:hypothetical protein [Opitutaceae bacterium]